MARFAQVGFLGFDVFGTVVDWLGGVARAAAPFLLRHGVNVDPSILPINGAGSTSLPCSAFARVSVLS